MRRGVKRARHRLLSLLLAGLLLCSFLPVTVFAQDETVISETEAAVQIEDNESSDSPGETEDMIAPDDAPVDDTEEAAEDTTEPDELSDAENEEALPELTAFGVAAAVPPPDEVDDLAGLESWLANNPAGGTVTLSGNIEVTGNLALERINIDAKDFGFIVTGALVLRGGVRITGGGASHLIRVDGGELKMLGENDVTTTGEGGAALFLEAGSGYSADDSARPLFRAEGMDSVAIHSEIPLDLKYHAIQAADGAGLIESAEPVRLYLCRAEAGGAASLPTNVTLDTCIVSPSVSGGTVISRKLAGVTLHPSFLFAAGEAASGFFDNQKVRCALTLSAAGVEDLDEMAFILLDDTGVDYDKPGEYLVPGVLEPPDDDLYAFDIVTEACPIAASLTIYDPGIPYFYSYYKARGGAFVICYYYTGDFDALTLWRSDDGGESWRVYWKPGDEDSGKFQINHKPYSLEVLFFDAAELSAPALFTFEVGEGVGSDILCVDAQAVENMGHGGDRDSGDRILLPWELFFGSPANNDNGEGNGNTGGNTNPPPNTDGKNPAPEDETDSQGLSGLGGSDGSGGFGDNGGDTNPKPDTEKKQSAQNANGSDTRGHAGDNIPVSVAPVTENPGALLPAGTAPLDTPSGIIASAAAVPAGLNPGAPGEPDSIAPPAEYEDETTIAISGKRLKALMQVNPQMVSFARAHIQVWIPAGLLTGLHLADTDIFTIEVKKPAQPGVSVLFFINGKALTEPFAEPFLAGIPWADTNGEIICTDSSGKPIPFEYDRQNGLLTLTLYECGTCTIETEPGVAGNADSADTPISGNPAEVVPEPISEQAPASSPFFPMLAVSLTGAGGVGGLAYVFRKRRVKRVI